MKQFIKFVFNVTEALRENGTRFGNDVTVFATSTLSGKQSYYEKTKRFEVQINSIFSADLINEEEGRILLQDGEILVSDEVMNNILYPK